MNHLATVLDAGPEEMSKVLVQMLAVLTTNGTLIQFYALLSKLTCSKFDENDDRVFARLAEVNSRTFVLGSCVSVLIKVTRVVKKLAHQCSIHNSLRLSRSRLCDHLLLLKLEMWFN